MSDTEKVFTCEEVKELCRDAFDTGTLYERESTYYGVDAVAYDWEHWIKRHDLASYVAGHKDESTEDQDYMSTMHEIWRLKERYPKSDPYDIHDSFENGFSAGYAAGHKDGVKEGHEDMNLRDVTAKSYSQGYEDGYEAGYNDASNHWQEDCRQLRECLRAILDKGETPEESGSKADRG